MYDVKIYVCGFYEINYCNATIYVCITNVCYVYAFIDSNIATRDVCRYVYMYASMYAILYIYDFTESNITTRYYVFRNWYDIDAFLVSPKSPIRLK